VLTRKNAIGILMGVELILNAAHQLHRLRALRRRSIDGQCVRDLRHHARRSGGGDRAGDRPRIYQNFDSIDVEATDSLGISRMDITHVS